MDARKIVVLAATAAFCVAGCDPRPLKPEAAAKPDVTEKQLAPWERCPASLSASALEDCISALRQEAVTQGGTWVIAVDKDSAIFVDLANVQNRSTSEKQGWFTQVYRSTGRDEVTKRPYKFSMARWIYDCASKRSAPVQGATFQEDGTPVDTGQVEDTQPALQNVVPGTTGEALLDFMCEPAKALKKYGTIMRVPSEFSGTGHRTELSYAKYIYGLKDCKSAPFDPSVGPSEAEAKVYMACVDDNNRWRDVVLGKAADSSSP